MLYVLGEGTAKLQAKKEYNFARETEPSPSSETHAGAVSRVDKMSVVKVYCKIARLDLTVNFHHGHFIDPTNCPWVSEDEPSQVSVGFDKISFCFMQETDLETTLQRQM